jgi:hypothetical protein
MQEVLENFGWSLGVGTVSGASANGVFNFLFAVSNSLAGCPNNLIKKYPNITSSELLEKFEKYTDFEFKLTMIITFATLLFVTIIYGATNKLFCQTHANDPNQQNNLTPTTVQNLKKVAKIAGSSFLGGSALSGGFLFVRAIDLHNFPMQLAKESPVISDIIRRWSDIIEVNIVVGAVLILGAFLALTPIIAAKPIHSLFWRPNNSGESTPLVNSAVLAPKREPATFNNHSTL